MYNLNFFIQKALSIPAELWIVNSYGYEDKHCILGHCGVRAYHEDINLPEEANAIENIFYKYGLNTVDVNDGRDTRFPQPTPDQRIIAALYWIRGQMAVEQAQEIVNKVGEVVWEQ